MLEHFEITELEEKWNEYNNKKSKFSKKFSYKKIIIGSVISAMILGSVIWLFSSNKKDDNTLKTIQAAAIKTEAKSNNTTIYKESNKTVEKKEISNPNTRGTLNFNDIGINSSVDAGGFIVNNTYEKEKSTILGNEKPFASIPKDEIIDFGNPPAPPKTSSTKTYVKKEPENKKGKVIIKTTPLRVNTKSLEDKFYASNDILYALKLAQSAYDNKRYDEAIKWALISNEIDKNNAKSWVIFAKANYKRGNKQDALIALENFNARISNPEVIATIKQIKNGDLR